MGPTTAKMERPKRLGYGELEEEILAKFNPYPDLPEGVTADQFWSTPPLHERVIDPVRLNKALEQLLQVDKEALLEKKKEQAEAPKVSIKRSDLDRFIEETGLKSFQAEEYFVLAKGDLEEALLIWVNQEPGKPPRKLSEYENVVRSVPIKE
jgi:hypothetical protein